MRDRDQILLEQAYGNIISGEGETITVPMNNYGDLTVHLHNNAVTQIDGLPEHIKYDLHAVNKYLEEWKNDKFLNTREKLLTRVIAAGLYEDGGDHEPEDGHIDQAYEDRYADNSPHFEATDLTKSSTKQLLKTWNKSKDESVSEVFGKQLKNVAKELKKRKAFPKTTSK